jgi:hypothetical protein
MIFGLVVGGGLLLIGTRMLGAVILFYLGQRRDLYFHPEGTWQGMARLGGTLVIMGGGMMLAAWLSDRVTIPVLLPLGAMVSIVWWIVIPWLTTLFPPQWLARLEKGRPPDDLEAILNNGATRLQTHPRLFRQIIRDPAGWESWLMTVTHALPIVLLESYRQRAELAMEYHLYPVAVRIAERIIHYRPDQALGYHLRARANEADRRYHAALADLTTCIAYEPANPLFYVQRARIYLILDEDLAALQNIEDALRLKPDCEDALALWVIAEKRLERVSQ